MSIVQDSGPFTAKIMLVGEAPGREEALKGLPFIGSSGKLLRSMLTHVGIDPSSCYITNVVDTQPPKNDFTVFYEDKSRRRPTPQLLTYWEKLRTKVRQLKPSVVIALGAEALRALTNKHGISDYRGCPILFEGIPIIPTYHPAAVLREFSLHVICELDFSKAKKLAGQALVLKDHKFILQPNLSEVLAWFKSLKAQDIVSFDLESIGERIRCIGFATERSAICVPFFTLGFHEPITKDGSTLIGVGESSGLLKNYWTVEQELLVLETLADFFRNPSIQKVGQNSICFDEPFITREFKFEFKSHDYDIMHMFHVLYPELPKGLDFFCSIYTDYPNYWSGKNGSVDREEWIYNLWDCVVTLEAYHKIRAELVESKLYDFYTSHVLPLARSLAKAQETGAYINSAKQKSLLVDLESRCAEALTSLRNKIGRPDFNPDSNPQLKALLFNELKLTEVTNKKGVISTDAECLAKLQDKHPDCEILQDILDYRKTSKLQDFLLTKTDSNNRMHTSFNASGTETGRISSSKNIFGQGMNLQNIPKSLRTIFEAPPGRVLVKQDLSQAEARVVAEILRRHGYPSLSDKYFNDPLFDIHTWMAAMVFKKPEDQITKHERQLGKVGNHSGNYQAGPPTFQATAIKFGIKGMTYQQAAELRANRIEALPGLLVWWAWVEEQLRKTRTLSTCLGRRRMFFGRLDSSTFRSATAFEPQSIVGDVNNIIFRRCSMELPEDCYTILQVHDETVVECPEAKVSLVISKFREITNSILLPINPDRPLIIPGDISIGTNWKDCQPI